MMGWGGSEFMGYGIAKVCGHTCRFQHGVLVHACSGVVRMKYLDWWRAVFVAMVTVVTSSSFLKLLRDDFPRRERLAN
jgi:hypothetical protein